LVQSTFNYNAITVNQRIARTAATSIILRIVSLIDWTTLTNVLNHNESRLAYAYSINQYLISSTWITASAPLSDFIIDITFGALPALSVDSVVAIDTIAV
jgi:hypothetical protein